VSGLRTRNGPYANNGRPHNGSGPYTGPDTDTQLRALQTRERLSEQQIYTGPETSSQLIALRHLEQIAQQQSGTGRGTGLLDRPAPPGPAPQTDPRWRRRDIPEASAPSARRHRPEPAPRSALSDLLSVPWPLYAVLAVQAVLTLRLIWHNTAFVDESLYIWAGRIELWQLTGGTPVPNYSSYFSGAPVLYPPLAGMTDIIGGLTAARIMSLLFMLGVTCMLWGSARSLFGQRVALCSVALFVALGSTQFLGSLATYDAMALFLLTLSARLVIAARDRDDSSPLVIVAIVALVLANATKYATALFDPVVFLLAASTSPRGRKAGAARAGFIGTVTIALVSFLSFVAGSTYVKGIKYTTLSRQAGGQSPMVVLDDSARWIGAVVAIALVAVLVAMFRDKQYFWFFALLTVTGALVPLNQARIHTTVSLSKHVDFGAWFACIVAGYAIALLTRVSRRKWISGPIAVAIAVAVLIPAGLPGRNQAVELTNVWPNTTQLTAELKSLVPANPGVYLAEDQNVPAYYLENKVPWQDWVSTSFFQFVPPGGKQCIGGPAASGVSRESTSSPAMSAYASAIKNGYFGLLIFSNNDTPQVDSAILGFISQYGTYRLVADIPYTDETTHGNYTIWARTTVGMRGPHGSACTG
jgi:hypothetical protein